MRSHDPNTPKLVSAPHAALQTDLYELTMAQAYLEAGQAAPATFDLFIRRAPQDKPHSSATRNYFVAAGLADTLDLIEHFRFPPDAIEHLRTTDRFSATLLDHLATIRFTGDIHAVHEGTPIFPGEPIVRIDAPIIEAQLLEPLIMNQIGFQTLVASKASRITHAANGTPCIDFGLRRAHGFDAGLKAARAAYIAGFDATSNPLAERLYNIPAAGTMAHSFIESFDNEARALEVFANAFPGTTLLVDTYDTLAGIDTAIKLHRTLPHEKRFSAIRLDSGDLLDLSRTARRKLDDAGLHHINVFASSSLDEHAIHRLITNNAPIDGFGVGTALTTAEDAPGLDSAYKLAAYDGRPRMKSSANKATLPGVKQVYRLNADSEDMHDLIALARETPPPGAIPLLANVMQGGRRTEHAPTTSKASLDHARERHREHRAHLPPHLRDLEPADPPYTVRTSQALANLRDTLQKSLTT